MNQPAPKGQPVQPFQVTRYTLASPPSGEHFQFATSARSGDGKFRFIWTLAPGKRGPGHHCHPRETESFEIVSGTLRIWINDVPRDYVAGDRVDVPPGVMHRFLAPTKEPAVCNVTLDGPALEDVFVPTAVANADNPSAKNMLRFMVTTLDTDGSKTEPSAFVSFLTAIVRFIRWCGVKPFEPVYGWDKPTSV